MKAANRTRLGKLDVRWDGRNGGKLVKFSVHRPLNKRLLLQAIFICILGLPHRQRMYSYRLLSNQFYYPGYMLLGLTGNVANTKEIEMGFKWHWT